MPELHQLLETAASIAREVAAPESSRADRDGVWVEQTMAALKESRLTGLVVPQAQGGHGEGLYALVRISEELGKAYASGWGFG